MKDESKKETDDLRSPWAIGYAMSTQITAISLEAALYVLGGFWLDRYLGSLPIFTLIGALLGGVVLVLRLLTLVQKVDQKK